MIRYKGDLRKFWTCISQKKGFGWIYQLILHRYYEILAIVSSLEVILRVIQNATSAIETFKFSFLTSSIRTFIAENWQSSRGQWKWCILFLLQPHESGDGQFRRGSSFPVLILTRVKYYCRRKNMLLSELVKGTYVKFYGSRLFKFSVLSPFLSPPFWTIVCHLCSNILTFIFSLVVPLS